MPHIVLDRRIDLFDFFDVFTPIFQKSPLIRIPTVYVEKSGNTAILPAVVADDKHQKYFIQIMSGDKKTTIRLLPQTDPKKTDAVKLSLAKVYCQMKTHYPDILITKSNLFDYVQTCELA